MLEVLGPFYFLCNKAHELNIIKYRVGGKSRAWIVKSKLQLNLKVKVQKWAYEKNLSKRRTWRTEYIE